MRPMLRLLFSAAVSGELVRRFNEPNRITMLLFLLYFSSTYQNKGEEESVWISKSSQRNLAWPTPGDAAFWRKGRDGERRKKVCRTLLRRWPEKVECLSVLTAGRLLLAEAISAVSTTLSSPYIASFWVAFYFYKIRSALI